MLDIAVPPHGLQVPVIRLACHSARCIGYLTKYLTKHVGGCHQATTSAQRAHAVRLAEALRYLVRSPDPAGDH